MAGCCCLRRDLTQPSYLLQAFSNTRARHRVPKAGGTPPRPGRAGLAPTGSQPLGNWPCILRAKQNHHHPHEKPQSPKTDLSPSDQHISQTYRGKTRGSAASTALCPQGPRGRTTAAAPLRRRLSRGSRDVQSREVWSAAWPGPEQRKLILYKRCLPPSWETAGSLLLPRAEIYMAGGGVRKHTSLSNWIPLDLYSIWDDNEVVNTEIQDSNKPLTFIDLGVNLNHHLVTRRWVIYSSPSCPRSSRGSQGEQQHEGACERRGQ